MHRSRTLRTGARLFVIAGLAGALTAGAFPVSAFGDTQSELAAAQAKLEGLGREYTQLQSDLQKASQDLEETKGEIDTTAEKLSSAQAELSDSATVDYKVGNGGLLRLVLGASNFNELISRVFYADKVNEAQAEAISNVKTLKASLETKQAEQEKRLESAQDKVDREAENQKSAQALVNSLSSQVKAELEARAAQNEDVAAGLQSSKDATEAPASTASITGAQSAQEAVKPSDSRDNRNDASDAGSSNPGKAPSPSSSNAGGGSASNSASGSNSSSGGSNSAGGSSSGSSASKLPSNPSGGNPLAIAFQYQGAPYVYGGETPSEGGFDCSGLVYWSYLRCGITLPRTDSAQREYIKANGTWTTDPSQFQYGDLVFFPGHVAFYVGNGQVYGARRPGVGASTTSMYYFGTIYGAGHL